jgi:phage N-6-adenine-methyltransferase
MNTEWSTPQPFFDKLNEEFNFTLDVCALPHNSKCEKYFTPVENALLQDWSHDIFWMNPPYGRGQNVYAWVKKAYESAQQGTTGVCLLPGSIDTKWFHEFCLNAAEIRFVKDRLWFTLNGKTARGNHGSMIVIFTKKCNNNPHISSIRNGRNKSLHPPKK